MVPEPESQTTLSKQWIEWKNWETLQFTMHTRFVVPFGLVGLRCKCCFESDIFAQQFSFCDFNPRKKDGLMGCKNCSVHLASAVASLRTIWYLRGRQPSHFLTSYLSDDGGMKIMFAAHMCSVVCAGLSNLNVGIGLFPVSSLSRLSESMHITYC